MKKVWIPILAGSLLLGACGNNQNQKEQSQNSSNDHMQHMDHGAGHMPAGMMKEMHPKYHSGEHVMMMNGHMKGMKGAIATVKDAYKTKAYEVSYKTKDGEVVKHHRWVVNEEIKNPKKEGYKKGDKVILNADHMKGMKGSEATIDKVEDTTVYTVDYTPTDGGKKVKNHMWMTEDELKAK